MFVIAENNSNLPQKSQSHFPQVKCLASCPKLHIALFFYFFFKVAPSGV